jgi:3-oxoacyl-[acyl-carrier-protein] synthase II
MCFRISKQGAPLMGERFVIRGLSTISALGASFEEIAETLRDSRCGAVPFPDRSDRPVFRLTKRGETAVREVSRSERYSRLDRVTLLALVAARETFQSVLDSSEGVGCVSIGSSRGATGSLERAFNQFLASPSKIPSDTSPVTTAGNISSWVAQEYLSKVPQEHGAGLASVGTSMTCSSAFHSLLTSVAFLKSGLSDVALFGGAEACLTPFTVSQLEALRLYAEPGVEWPCRPLGVADEGFSGVVLGEGAGTALLVRESSTIMPQDLELIGLGWSLEGVPSATGVSPDGGAFEQSMRMAIQSLRPDEEVDTVVAHAPGSIKGDRAELAAVRRVLGGVPITSTKHLSGHTYGASGMISLALAQALIEGIPWRGFPYLTLMEPTAPDRAKVVLINTAGFGGNAVTVIVSSRNQP